MNQITEYLEESLLDHALEGAAFAQPANLYWGLSTTTIQNDGSNLTEPAGGSYARKLHNTMNAAVARRITNNGQITWPTATAGWGTLVDWFISDQPTGGNILAVGTLPIPKTIVSGNTAAIADGAGYIEWVAGAITTYLGNKLLDHAFKVASYSQPDNFVALSTTTPTDDGGAFTEPAGGGYARVDFDDWSAAASSEVHNATDITFPSATAPWGTITYAGTFDALVAGNLLHYSVMTPQYIDTDDQLYFPSDYYSVRCF